MPRIRFLAASVALLCLLGAVPGGALAQTAPPASSDAPSTSGAAAVRGPLGAVEVRGTDTYADIVRAIITSRPGTPAERVDLEAERNRIYGLGTFATVTVAIEQRGGAPVLVVDVSENPRIDALVFEGNEVVPDGQLATALARENLLEAGAIYNTKRAQEAIATIQRIYRDPGAPFSAGFPFAVPVTLRVERAGEAPAETTPGTTSDAPSDAPTDAGAEAATDPGADLTAAEAAAADEPVRLVYAITEDAPLQRVRFENATALDEAQLEALFAPLERAGTFDFAAYQSAVEGVAQRYRELGFRGSGVDATRSELQNGTLTVRLRELRIAAIDTTAIGVDASELTLAEGDLFDYDTLLQDVRRLASGRTGDVRLVFRTTARGDAVRVTFEQGPPASAGPIDAIEIEGNTVFTDEELRAEFTLQEGDTFTSTLAQEDFLRLAQRYEDAGYRLLMQPAFSYMEDDGTYVQRVTELKVAGYELNFLNGAPNVEPFVVTRYLPEPGSVLNFDDIRQGLLELSRLGVVRPVGITPRFADEQPNDPPDLLLVALELDAQETGEFTPAAQYATDSGFSASVSYSQSNFLGRAHSLSAEITGQTSDVGLLFGGSVRYSIPWLYLDVLDLQQTPTDVSASLFSVVAANQPLTADGSTQVTFPGLAESEANTVAVGEYTQRSTGASLSLGRPIAPATRLRLAARGSFTSAVLEPPATDCTFDANGDVENGDDCSLPSSLAAQYLPQGGLAAFVSGTVSYDDRDSPEFPRRGIAASGSLGVGFGNDYRDPVSQEQTGYVYEQLEVGARTYLLLADLIGDLEDRNHVFAFKLNAGHQFGGNYPAAKRFRVGQTNNDATMIRGYTVDDFNLSRSYAVGSVEYRYDFGFDTFATQTIIGIAFVDLGYASSVPGFSEYAAPLFVGAGLGVQVNLGFGGVALPALRFDYGFSERNPTGVFSFRIGPVF